MFFLTLGKEVFAECFSLTLGKELLCRVPENKHSTKYLTLGKDTGSGSDLCSQLRQPVFVSVFDRYPWLTLKSKENMISVIFVYI